jgi:hypothetical protein
MEDGIANLEQLISLMQERDEVHAEYTVAIANMLHPTVLSALQEILGARNDQIEWTEIVISPEDLTLRIMCAVTYSERDNIPAFVVASTPAEGLGAEGDTRMIRVGIPITYSLRPKEEIVAFFHQLITDGQQTSTGYEASEVIEPTPASTLQFDLSNLSKDQVVNLLAFQHYTSREKH